MLTVFTEKSLLRGLLGCGRHASALLVISEATRGLYVALRRFGIKNSQIRLGLYTELLQRLAYPIVLRVQIVVPVDFGA